MVATAAGGRGLAGRGERGGVAHRDGLADARGGPRHHRPLGVVFPPQVLTAPAAPTTGTRVSAAMPAATLGREPTRAAAGGAVPRRTEGQRGESRPRARAPRPPRGGAGRRRVGGGGGWCCGAQVAGDDRREVGEGHGDERAPEGVGGGGAQPRPHLADARHPEPRAAADRRARRETNELACRPPHSTADDEATIQLYRNTQRYSFGVAIQQVKNVPPFIRVRSSPTRARPLRTADPCATLLIARQPPSHQRLVNQSMEPLFTTRPGSAGGNAVGRPHGAARKDAS